MLVAIVVLGTYATSFAQIDTTDREWIRTELYFAQADRNNKPISNEAWLRFVHKSIAPAFHDGFSIIRVTGGWTNAKHHFAEEPSRVVIVVYPKAQAQTMDEAIRRLSSQFVREFNEEAVLRVDSKAEATFYTK